MVDVLRVGRAADRAHATLLGQELVEWLDLGAIGTAPMPFWHPRKLAYLTNVFLAQPLGIAGFRPFGETQLAIASTTARPLLLAQNSSSGFHTPQSRQRRFPSWSSSSRAMSVNPK